jgi:4-amino-4-deoxy-L-arabinose transferase-like glycosyltransferase
MRRDILAAAVVAVAAVLPRILILSATSNVGLFGDMGDYYDRARHLFEHGRLYPGAFRVPGYPVAIAASFAALGPNLWSVRILQCAILTLTAVVTFAIAKGVMSRWRALIAGLIVAWYPGFLLYSIYVMAEPLFTLLVLLAILTARSANGPLAMVGAGVFAGLATMTRQVGVGVAAALVMWAAFGRGAPWNVRAALGQRALMAASVAAGMSLALAPWAARNYTLYEQWMPLETTGGINFLMSNYEDATGTHVLADWEAVHQRYLAGERDEFTRNAAAYRIGFDQIARDPLRILKLLPIRLAHSFDLEGREHVFLYTSTYFGPRSRSVVVGFGWALLISFPVLVIAAVVAVFFGRPLATPTESLILWVFAVMTVQLLTVFGDPRFHLPLVPLLAILAMRPAKYSLTNVFRSKWRTGIGVVVLLVAVVWWGTRVPPRIRALEQAASPEGWESAMPY